MSENHRGGIFLTHTVDNVDVKGVNLKLTKYNSIRPM